MDRIRLHLIKLMAAADRGNFSSRLLTGMTVLLLILAGSPFLNTDTGSNNVDAAENPYASPSITNLTNSGPTSSGSFIFWDTNVSSNSRVYYGISEADVNNLTNGSWSIWNNDTFNVSIRVSGLSANTTYYYKPESVFSGAANDSVPASMLVTLKPGVWTSPAEYMVSPSGWMGSPVNFRTVNISAAILNNNGRYVTGLSLEAVIYNMTGTEIGRTNLSGTGPYSGNFTLPDYSDEGAYAVRIEGYSNVAGEFSVLRWGCANCHSGGGVNYPSTFDAAAVHPEHFETTDINTVHCGDDLCETQTTYTSTEQCQGCHLFKAPSWANHPYPRQRVECSDCHKSPSGENAALACENCHGDRTTAQNALSPRYGQDRHYLNATCNDCHGNLTSMVTKPNCQNCHPRPNSILNNTIIPGSIENTTHSTQKTVACGLCHNREHDVKSLYTLNATVCRTCHSGITHDGGAQCTTCHGKDPHNISFFAGPNCVDCHDKEEIALHQVNSSAMNSSGAIHANLNKNATNSTGISAENKKCWGCHDSTGSQPANDSMGSRFNNPYKCYDCHNGTGKPYGNVSNAPNVSQHFINGTGIKAALNASGNSSSCTVCHNLTEMKVDYSEDDSYNSDYSLPSHYGRSRALDPRVRQGNDTNCAYCHQNTSTAFTVAMTDLNNSNISNHSLHYNNSNPGCVGCHNSGWIHNSTLTKPALALPNSTFCLSCHGSNGTGGTNYSGMLTGIREKHNDSINCTECHLNTSRDIHPVKYLQSVQSDVNYSTSNSTGVNCINCHQDPTFNPNLSITPPKIPSPLHHSDNPSNGTRWNSSGYWDNTSEITACIYCHNDTKHMVAALGRPESWRGNNIVNSSITNTSNWCAGCHYQGYSNGGKNYGNMISEFIPANLSVPPEITNGTYAPYTISGYFNHTLTDYSDITCKKCHSIGLDNGTMDTFVHNITARDCKGCHFSYSAMSSSGNPTRYINSDMFNDSAHSNVRCEKCHTGGHNNIGARKACEDCHAVRDSNNSRERHNITGDPDNYKVGGVSVVDITDCTICHDQNLYNKAKSTYGIDKPIDCDYCHTYPDKSYS